MHFNPNPYCKTKKVAVSKVAMHPETQGYNRAFDIQSTDVFCHCI